MIALQLAEKQNFENLKYKKTLKDLANLAADCVEISWKIKFLNLKCKKTLADCTDLADDCVAISWKTKFWNIKYKKNSCRFSRFSRWLSCN